MAHLDILSPHEHDIANIEQIDPIHLAHPAIAFDLGRLGHSQPISLSGFVLVGVSFHSFNLLDRTEAHL